MTLIQYVYNYYFCYIKILNVYNLYFSFLNNTQQIMGVIDTRNALIYDGPNSVHNNSIALVLLH